MNGSLGGLSDQGMPGYTSMPTDDSMMDAQSKNLQSSSIPPSGMVMPDSALSNSSLSGSNGSVDFQTGVLDKYSSSEQSMPQHIPSNPELQSSQAMESSQSTAHDTSSSNMPPVSYSEQPYQNGVKVDMESSSQPSGYATESPIFQPPIGHQQEMAALQQQLQELYCIPPNPEIQMRVSLLCLRIYFILFVL